MSFSESVFFFFFCEDGKHSKLLSGSFLKGKNTSRLIKECGVAYCQTLISDYPVRTHHPSQIRHHCVCAD